MQNSKDFIVDLRTAAWRTSGARFNAARRLKRRDWFATFSIAMFSAIAVGIAIAQAIYKFDGAVNNYLTALSVFIGIFVIVISLIEWGLKGQLVGEKLYENAVRLNQFQRKLAQVLACPPSDLDLNSEITRLREEYETIKNSCPFNHEPIDDRLFQAQQRLSVEFSNSDGKPRICWGESKKIELHNIFFDLWYFGVFWLLILALLVKVSGLWSS